MRRSDRSRGVACIQIIVAEVSARPPWGNCKAYHKRDWAMIISWSQVDPRVLGSLWRKWAGAPRTGR